MRVHQNPEEICNVSLMVHSGMCHLGIASLNPLKMQAAACHREAITTEAIMYQPETGTPKDLKLLLRISGPDRTMRQADPTIQHRLENTDLLHRKAILHLLYQAVPVVEAQEVLVVVEVLRQGQDHVNLKFL